MFREFVFIVLPPSFCHSKRIKQNCHNRGLNPTAGRFDNCLDEDLADDLIRSLPGT